MAFKKNVCSLFSISKIIFSFLGFHLSLFNGREMFASLVFLVMLRSELRGHPRRQHVWITHGSHMASLQMLKICQGIIRISVIGRQSPVSSERNMPRCLNNEDDFWSCDLHREKIIVEAFGTD